ncbi:MAG: arsenate reductase ArsC [Deltaproteobacteria bacterium]|nr:arsenate reductase ArsC [Deltaproteobacteria bacterium]
MKNILFICVYNAARSQMADGWAKKLLPPDVQVWSAGSSPAYAVSAEAVKVMAEVDIDISKNRPKSIDDIPMEDIDLVIKLCAEEQCPIFPRQVACESWAMPDPGLFAFTEKGALQAFRETRDAIRQKIEELSGRL